MLVDVGPLPSASVVAFVGFAQSVVAQARADPSSIGATVTEDVLDEFERYLDQWAEVAAARDEFRWVADVDPDVVVYLVYGFFKVAEKMVDAANRRGTRLMPAAGQTFYRELVGCLLTALAAQGEPTADFAEHLRTFWPTLDEGPQVP